MSQNIYFTNSVAEHIDKAIANIGAKQVFVICDTNTSMFALPLIAEASEAVRNGTVITIQAGDVNKTLDSVRNVYTQLLDGGATRHSAVINLGGGMVTDLGGFAAATFKRGMPFINVPTTLLGAVDAAVGGKTGVNFGGIKNIIGCFRPADAVIISTIFFSTLTHTELLSGYAEMIKHAVLSGPEALADIMHSDPVTLRDNPGLLLDLLRHSVHVKAEIVAADPTETGIRKALNLGHTVGHAFEALAMHRHDPVAHGYAVAWGLVVESILSVMRLKLSSETLHAVACYIRDNYGTFAITCDDYAALLSYMRQDKKNDSAESINFTLLDAPGKVHTDIVVPDKDITAALDIYRDIFSL